MPHMRFRSLLPVSQRVIALLAGLSGLVGVSSAQDTGAPNAIDQIRRATVAILVSGPEGESGGSGFILTPDGVIATAAHVIAGAKQATVRLMTGEEYAVAGVLTVDVKRDFALIRIGGFDEILSNVVDR